MLQLIAVIVGLVILGKLFSFMELIEDFFPMPLQIFTAIVTVIAFFVYSIPGAVIAFIVCSVISVLIGLLLAAGGTVAVHMAQIVGPSTLLVTGVLCTLGYFAFSWIGVFVIAAVGIGISLAVQQVARAGKHITKTLEAHDQEKTKAALINRQTVHEQAVLNNDRDLMEELEKNCRWLGFTNAKSWHQKLSNYASKEYTDSFDAITQNFAKQMEHQNITQNGEWFEPFMKYIVAHPAGTTRTKMLSEVHCPQLAATHATPDEVLLQKQLTIATKAKSGDVPALLKEQPLSDYDEPLYLPTSYAMKLYSQDDNSEEKCRVELSFDEL